MASGRQIDVARKAGVSQSTVSFVLNHPDAVRRYRIHPKTAQRIKTVARELGYRPNMAARQLAGAHSRVIGMLMSAHIPPPTYERLARLQIAMESLAYRRSYRIVIGHFCDDQQIQAYADDFKSRGVEGLLCLHHETITSFEAIPRSLSMLSNVVYLDKPSVIKNPCYVQTDYAEGIRKAVRHLVKRGRKTIGIALAGARFRAMSERLRGYRESLKEARIPSSSGLIWVGPDEVDPRQEFMDRIIQQLVVKHGAQAILASNDMWAIQLIRALDRWGIRVPEDVGVVGYDNLEFSRLMKPELTTIDHDDQKIAREMFRMLMSLIEKKEGRDAVREVTVKPRLVVRESA